jgi:hypothetical protein
MTACDERRGVRRKASERGIQTDRCARMQTEARSEGTSHDPSHERIPKVHDGNGVCGVGVSGSEYVTLHTDRARGVQRGALALGPCSCLKRTHCRWCTRNVQHDTSRQRKTDSERARGRQLRPECCAGAECGAQSSANHHCESDAHIASRRLHGRRSCQ